MGLKLTKIDLLICNYNTCARLKYLLDTLHSDLEGDSPWNVYIADNGSQDGSYDWLIRNEGSYNISGIFKNANVGYSTAINSMAALGRSDLLAAVNADTWFTTNHIRQVISSFNDNPNQAVMGPKQMDSRGRIRHGGIFWDGSPGKNPEHRGWALEDLSDEKYKTRDRCWTVSGSLYYVRRSVWEELGNDLAYRILHPVAQGPFLPTFMYYEETFFSVFAQHKGYEVWYDGEVETAGHEWHASNKPGDNVSHFRASQYMYRETCNSLGIKHEV